MDIRGYLPTSLIEWPGKVAAVVFVPGCNFRCPFCHNVDLVDPQKIKRLKDISEKSIFEDLKKRKKWVDGVVLTGGEPSLAEGLENFLSRCKRMGFETMIETNGSRPEVIEKLVKERLVDFIAMDIKGLLDRYAQITNFQLPISKIKKSIKLIVNSGVDFEFRITVVPTIHTKSSMVKLAKQLKKLVLAPDSRLPTPNWFLQSFQPKPTCLDPRFAKLKPYPDREMKEILRAVQKYIPGAELRGM